MTRHRSAMMGAHWLALLIVAIVCFETVGRTNAACVTPRPADSSLFFTTPQNATLEACQGYSSNTCCRPAWTAQVAAGNDSIHTAVVTGVLTNMSTSCAKLYDDLACLFCSPNTNEFIKRINAPVGYEVLLCHSFCVKLRDACQDAIVLETNRTVGEEYPDGKDLCMSAPWYTPFFPEVVSDHPECFNPEIPECTTADYEGHYTVCVNNRRDYVYTWKVTEDGEPICSGGVKLPPNKRNLPCDIACQPGQYLPPGASACVPCEPGTFSIGGGVRYEHWNATQGWPSKEDGSITFSTYCQDTRVNPAVSKNCSGWELQGEYVSSGDNYANHNIESVLEVDAMLVEAANVSFYARVDSEVGYDGLRFELSATEKHTITARGEFKYFSYRLPKGPHTLRWVYYKDSIRSSGEDRAYISSLEIDGTSFADDSCTTCPPGTYAPDEGQSECVLCDFNQIPDSPPTSCKACDPDQYAIPGTAVCLPREICTEEDYEAEYSECRAPGVRDLTYQWIPPQICIDTNNIKPADQIGIPCEPCVPGQYRGSNFKCQYCPDGRTSNGGEAASCTPCPANTEAVKSQIHETFIGSEWPTGWETGCDHCDTNGFRRHYHSLDSGDGAALFFSWLSINQSFYTDGQFSLQATLECPNSDCNFAVWIDDTVTGIWFSQGKADQQINVTQPIPAGQHTFYIDFSRWNPSESHNATRVVIHSIQMVGTTEGGAANCRACPPGAISAEGSTSCNVCGPGTFPDPSGTGRCKVCPVDTITDRPGMEACIPCGNGTSTNGRVGASECTTNGCVFTADLTPDWPVTFNLSRLARYDSMWGPIFDPVNRQSYFLNVCTRDHANSTCRNTDGSIMDTFACQITAQHASKDLGRIMSFAYIPPQNLEEERVILSYSYGKQCEQDTWSRSEEEEPSNTYIGLRTGGDIQAIKEFYETAPVTITEQEGEVSLSSSYLEQRFRPMRATNVTIICDPTAGLGYPQAPPEGIEDPFALCRYEFLWYSIYGCHICTENDYDYRYTACENGLRTKKYYWKFSPRRCVDGVTELPADVFEACSPSTVVCGDGEYISPKLGNCTTCPPGNFSIGSGERTEWWSQDLKGFTVYCETDKQVIKPTCSGSWVPEGRTITAKGNLIDTTVLQAERNFISEGSVTFDFSLFTEKEEPFTFLIDDKVIVSYNHTTILGHQVYVRASISKGTHVFKWKFSPFYSDNKPRIAMIWSILFRGTQYSEAFCTPCPGNTVQEQPGSANCHVCPRNSVYSSPTQCTTCADNTFALPGDTMCRTMAPCAADDYYQVYGTCQNGQRSTYWLPKQPKICSGDATPTPLQVACECPKGYYIQDDKCVTCPAGKYHENGRCLSAEPGAAVVKVREWLSSAADTEVTVTSIVRDTKRDSGDHVWDTGCTGDCGTEGWRIMGAYADSGPHYDTAISWLSFHSTLETDGEILFTIDVSTHHPVGPDISLEFYIDDMVMNVPRQPNAQHLSFVVKAGRHRFLWIHRQASQAINGDYVTRLSNVVLTGTTDGGMVKISCPAGYFSVGNTAPCTPCAPGYYAPTSRSTQCVPCPHGTFAAGETSSECLRCGTGTVPNKEEAATTCLTTCKFDVNSTVKNAEGVSLPVTYHWDLTPLSKVPPLSSDAMEKLGMKFTMQLCDKMTPAQQANGCKQPTFVCEEEPANHEFFPAGSLLSFDQNPPEKLTDGFMLTYSHGSSKDCEGRERRSIIEMKCRIGATPYTMFKLDYEHYESAARACEFRFIMETEYACPFCTDQDIKVIHSECVEGSREIKYETKIPCLGVPKSRTESCSNIEVNEFAILVIAGAVVAAFGVLIAMAIFFWNKKRQMAQKYDLLVAESGSNSVEMQDLDQETGTAVN
eukprot:TRINITY_DN2795_c0_g1_i1.p1 TRINITY_DN2795_c0_g1~~TRINITY_DN2795_c0_g1_i1.p1  ORF type:complete len:1862 (-),score=142.29 TRINITY_DN2795_c0_g1_i1:134-5719(-)